MHTFTLKSTRFLGTFASAAILAALAPAVVANTTAQENVQPNDPVTLPEPAINRPEPTPEKNLSGFVSIVVPTDYISRGLVLNDAGFIAQPSGELDYVLHRGDDDEVVNKVTAFAGIWNNFNSAETGAGDDRWKSWYEFDWYVGGSVQMLDDWTLALTYIQFISPSDAFGESKNVELKIAYDDSDLLGRFALSPYAKIFRETDGKAGSGLDEGTYVELGIAPSVPLNSPGADYPVKLTFPVAVGLGFDEFYADGNGNDETLGFVSAGVVLGVPLKCLNDSGFGVWTFTAGASLYYFGNGTHDFNTNQGVDERLRLIGAVGLTCAF